MLAVLPQDVIVFDAIGQAAFSCESHFDRPTRVFFGKNFSSSVLWINRPHMLSFYAMNGA
jgi:hypothetical protein